MMAFLSNVPSPLLAISSFGVFSAVLVMVNYISVIIFYPTVIIMHHVSRKGRCCCGPMCGKNTEADLSAPVNELSLAEAAQSKGGVAERIIYFFDGWFFRNVITHKIARWAVVVIFAAIIVISIAFATRLGPDEEQVYIKVDI